MTQATIDFDAAARTFYEELDSGDPAVYERRFAPEVVFVFNDADPVSGSAAVGQFLDTWKGNFRSVTHDIVSITADPTNGSAAVEVVVKYVFQDGNVVNIKGCSVLDFSGDRIIGYRVYIDTSRLS